MFKHVDFISALGNITTVGFFGLSLNVVEDSMKFLCMIASLIVAYVTYKHTQEKRALLREQLKSERAKQIQDILDKAD